MATMEVRLRDLATRIATECKSLRTLVNNNVTDLATLATTAKGNLVAAINEVHGTVSGFAAAIAAKATLNDASAASVSETWSISKIKSEITAAVATAKNDLTNGASAALDTLAELAAALGNDANFATTMTTALSKRIRIDAAQTLTAAEKTQACVNLGVGEPDYDYVALFNSGLM